MTSADLLDRAVDEIVAGRPPAGADLGAEGVSLAVQAARIASAARAVPVSTGRADVRRLVLTTALRTRPSRRWSRWFVLVPTTVLLLGGGLAVAAGKAAPGDALYSLRRAVSAMRLAVALGDHAKAVAMLNRAEGTLNEAAALVSAGRLSNATEALRVFTGDLEAARAEITAAAGDTSDLTARADALAGRAAQIAELIQVRRVVSIAGGSREGSTDSGPGRPRGGPEPGKDGPRNDDGRGKDKHDKNPFGRGSPASGRNPVRGNGD